MQFSVGITALLAIVVLVQVLPLSAGAHVGTEGTFQILSAPPELHNYPGAFHGTTMAARSVPGRRS